MLFRHAHIEEPRFVLLIKILKPCAVLHGRRDRADTFVLPGELCQLLPEHCGKRAVRRDVRIRQMVYIESGNAVKFAGILFRRRKAFPLYGQNVNEQRRALLLPVCIKQHGKFFDGRARQPGRRIGTPFPQTLWNDTTNAEMQISPFGCLP